MVGGGTVRRLSAESYAPDRLEHLYLCARTYRSA
jgi:hypothetical protein